MGNCWGQTEVPGPCSSRTGRGGFSQGASTSDSRGGSSSFMESNSGAASSVSADSSSVPLSMSNSTLHAFSYSDLKAATRNFRPDSFLGEGGFGCVFKGWIDGVTFKAARPRAGLSIAVKVLNNEGMQGHREWLTEVHFLGQLHHKNLVKLIGFCAEDDHRLLVYDFMSRGSLENHLFRRGQSLSWATRLKVALGAAKGLAFLHNALRPVIYRDFKASNILLDWDFNAKLSDFGLAKDGPTGTNTHVTTRVMGTFGYAAPEYVATGHLSSKSDVYSFGVVLLEILTGRKVIDKNKPLGEQNLIQWATPYLRDRRKTHKIMDPQLEGKYNTKVAQQLIALAISCINPEPSTRPLMKIVVEVLEPMLEMRGLRVE